MRHSYSLYGNVICISLYNSTITEWRHCVILYIIYSQHRVRDRMLFKPKTYIAIKNKNITFQLRQGIKD